MEQFGYKNPMQVPRITKITLNMGVGEAVADKKILENAVADMTKIAGQKPIVTKSRKSVASFKIRDGWPIGCKVTLRRARMYEFLDRLINVALPRMRDFRGVSGRSFDGRGNYNFGVKEQIIFPEIDFDQVDAIRGMDIAITTTRARRRRSQGAARSLQLPVPQLIGRTDTMAKTSMVNRETKRAKLVKQYAAKRDEAEGDHPQPERVGRGEEGRGRSCRSCRATRARAPAQPLRASPAARAASTASSASAATSCAKRPCAATFRACARPAGNSSAVTGAYRTRTMSMTDPIADMLTRIRNAASCRASRRVDAVVEAEGGDREGAQGRRLHRRFRASTRERRSRR